VSCAGLFLALSACGTTTEPLAPCCYVGEVTLARASDVYLELEDGRKTSFSRAFPGFEPQSGMFTTAFPFRTVAISDVLYAALLPVLPQYDANGDGRIQSPELTVLYIREAALGLGHGVRYVGVNPRVDALVLSKSETGALVRYVNDNRHRMTPAAQTVFRELDLVGLDLRQKGSENDGPEKKIYIH
jgi:hypothetical protein